jgi:hypothetical protein
LSPPPGPPGAAMKSLDQVEPRTPISELPFTISESGSYYLTGNLLVAEGQGGIRIDASNVALDLMGFTLNGNGVGLWGIEVNGDGITIRDGNIVRFNGDGIRRVSGGTGENWILEGLRIRENSGAGIRRPGDHTRIRSVIVEGNGSGGVTGGRGVIRIDGSTIIGNGWGVQADGVIMIDSTVSANEGIGIEAGGGELRYSLIGGNAGHGVRGLPAAFWLIDGCVVSGNGGDGIRIASGEWSLHGDVETVSDSTAMPRIISGSTVAGNTGSGILVEASLTRIEANYVISNRVGIDVILLGNIVIKNTVSGNTEMDFRIADGNQVGLIGTMEEVGHHPWANFLLGEPENEEEGEEEF